MSHSASTFDMQTFRRPCRLSLRSGLLALVIALPCAPLLAGTTGDATRANTTSAPQEQVAWISGGIGDEALADMRKVAAAYNVHVVFSEPRLGCMRDTGSSNDQRIMRHRSGRLFWCQVEGRCLDQNDPFAAAVWSFSDLSAARPVAAEFTAREREIAQFLVTGKTSKEIARQLGISHRTIEAHRARLMKKLNASTPGEMIARLAGGG